ncbi:hypothetical protein K437DRAFT_270230 [Tilletiaria anomala UBC 951]|uniref:Succinate dehydrogenase [ubiquinone] cytochrome b small subunit n=1 Tax=Tilletiaria anomala (strain ATCC 24038 / CBS 436.72 / UBC 951) TaxID=1037660 RepID=A0A066VLZ5_TILAU|nr:uncharacterized protein K437DRAFT_270230 [Tilletiaria anomala UBC 951]KDN39610.1 hypothetical protein K437DRAFT_270230 [Tilletiaria anomala UBC 951]
MAPLRLSSAATNPHLRLMMVGASRAFASTSSAQMRSTKGTHASNAQASYIKGTVNDPTTFPPPSASHGSYHWAFERAISVAIVPIIAAAGVKHGTSGLLDGALALTLVVHSHLGFEQIVADYLHKRKYPILGPVSSWGLRAATLASIYGLYEFNTNDIGLSELVAKLWTA